MMKLKADRTKSRQAKETINPGLFLYARVVIRHQCNCMPVFIYTLREIPLFYQRCNALDVENSKPTGQHTTTALSVSESQSSWLSRVQCSILTASMEKSTRSVNFTENEKQQAYFVSMGEPGGIIISAYVQQPLSLSLSSQDEKPCRAVAHVFVTQ